MSEATDVTVNRERGIGGSDIPAIMGISPFVSRWQLLQYKHGYEVNEFRGNNYTEFGNIMEPKIRDYINNMWDTDFAPGYIEKETDQPLSLYYHSDGESEKEQAILEIKTTSKTAREFDALDTRKSFDEYATQYYMKYVVQLLYGMHLHNYRYGWLAVYERPDDMDTEFHSDRLQVFQYDMIQCEELLKNILGAVDSFRLDFLYMKDNPWASESDLPSYSPLVPTANMIMQLENEIEYAQEIIKQYDNLKKTLCEKMQTYNVKSWTMPNGTKVTLVPKGESKVVQVFDEKKFADEHGDLYEQYTTDKTKEGRSAYVRLTTVAKGKKA